MIDNKAKVIVFLPEDGLLLIDGEPVDYTHLRDQAVTESMDQMFELDMEHFSVVHGGIVVKR